MLAIAMEVSLKAIMENHVYTFEGEIRKQSEGGPIGSETAQAASRLALIAWDKAFLRLLKRLKIIIELYKRYVDDITLATRLMRNMKFDPATVTMVPKTTEEIEEDLSKADDEVTMQQLREIADSITEMFKLEEDYPSNHRDGHVPILDLKVWVETQGVPAKRLEGQNEIENMPSDETDDQLPSQRMEGIQERTTSLPEGWIIKEVPQIRFEFYSKPMASQRVMAEASAAPVSQKRTVLTQEGIRRLLNCSEELPWTQKAKHLSNYMQKLRNSGYSSKFRQEILLSTLSGFKKIQEAAKNGVRPMYRNKNWNKKDRIKKKLLKKKNWLWNFLEIPNLCTLYPRQ